MNVSSPPTLVDTGREEEAPFGSAQQGPNPPTTIPIRSSSSTYGKNSSNALIYTKF